MTAAQAYKTYEAYCERIGNEPEPYMAWLKTSEIYHGTPIPIGWNGARRNSQAADAAFTR